MPEGWQQLITSLGESINSIQKEKAFMNMHMNISHLVSGKQLQHRDCGDNNELLQDPSPQFLQSKRSASSRTYPVSESLGG